MGAKQAWEGLNANKGREMRKLMYYLQGVSLQKFQLSFLVGLMVDHVISIVTENAHNIT